MDDSNTSFLLGWPIFGCYVSFGECMTSRKFWLGTLDFGASSEFLAEWKYHPQTAESLKGRGLSKSLSSLLLLLLLLLAACIRQMIERVYPIYDPCKVYLPTCTRKKQLRGDKYLAVPLILWEMWSFCWISQKPTLELPQGRAQAWRTQSSSHEGGGWKAGLCWWWWAFA